MGDNRTTVSRGSRKSRSFGSRKTEFKFTSTIYQLVALEKLQTLQVGAWHSPSLPVLSAFDRAKTHVGPGESSCPPRKVKGINLYLKSKINPHRSKTETAWPAHMTTPQVTEKLRVCRPMRPWPTLAQASHCLSASRCIKDKPRINQPHLSTQPLTPFISIHFPSCCANGVWLSQSIKEDIKLYSTIFPEPAPVCFSPAF